MGRARLLTKINENAEQAIKAHDVVTQEIEKELTRAIEALSQMKHRNIKVINWAIVGTEMELQSIIHKFNDIYYQEGENDPKRN